ncbi:ArnT family glycosyltransferase [Pseudomonas sp. H11T01]|uniref:ArnT family glycosyltransferase n=1 Tax=Pseudomonas sp. H11T01 TaxID=3402749 RepID=UPI003ABEB6A0
MKLKVENTPLFWSTAVMAALVLLLFFWGLGSIPFLSVNEARRAVSTREMHEAGQWLLPYMNGKLYLDKPPLFYWLTLISTQLAGVLCEWSMRLPSALFATICCVAVYQWGSKLAGSQVGLYATIFLAANAGFSLFARRAEIEMSLTGLCFLSLLAAWQYLFQQGSRRWVLLSYALLGCCLLTKGPVSLLLVTLPILAFAVWTRSSRAKAYLCDVPAWLIALAIGSSWYLAVSVQEGWGVWARIFQKDIVNKINGGGAEPWYAYLMYLAGDFFPFWLILFVRPRQLWQHIRSRPELMFLLCCVIVPLIVFSVFSEKHAKYLLPIYPAIALMLACHWARVLADIQGKWHRLLKWLPLVVLAGYAVFYSTFEARVFAHRVQVFPEIRSAFTTYPTQPIYSLDAPDMRVVYYAGRPVTPVKVENLQPEQLSGALLFTRAPLPASLEKLAPCTLARFEPYLHRKHAALLIGLGSSCPGGQ